MTHTHPTKFFFPAAALGLLLAATAAHAQSPFQDLQVDFAPIVQTVTANNSVTFSGTITNTTGSDVFLNGDTIDPLAAGLTTDDLPFVNTFLLGTPIKLGSFQTYSFTDLFTVTADDTVAPGLYKGTFAVFGGATPTSGDVSGSQAFYVRVPVPAVPEASTVVSFSLLLMSGLGVLAVKSRKRVPSA